MHAVEVLRGGAPDTVPARGFALLQRGQRRVKADKQHIVRSEQCLQLCLPARGIEDMFQDQVVARPGKARHSGVEAREEAGPCAAPVWVAGGVPSTTVASMVDGKMQQRTHCPPAQFCGEGGFAAAGRAVKEDDQSHCVLLARFRR